MYICTIGLVGFNCTFTFSSSDQCIFNLLLNLPGFSLGLLGRFSTDEDKRKFAVPSDTVFWFPTDEGETTWYDKILPALKKSLS